MNHIDVADDLIRTFDAAIGRMLGHELSAAQDAYQARLSYAQRMADAEADLRDQFLALANAGDLNAVATFSEPVPDWKNRTDAGIPKRPATLLDLIEDTAAFDDFAPQMFALFLRAANGSHISEDARELLEKMAVKFASMNVEDVK